MRGKHGAHAAKTARNRIIPAHAGQTRPQVPALGAITDHPRACGANKYPMICHVGRFGSSPRMRGKPGALNVPHSSSRIIPAHAGQTLRCCCRRCDIPDHPRACGANTSTRSAYSTLVGSSPRMRGKLGFGSTRQCRPRIIPAHAGQTAEYGSSLCFRTDHPRACGANKRSLVFNDPEYGSSPRMRGKLWAEQTRKRSDRIIPAHAGQTIYVENTVFGGSDHPRACGANLSFLLPSVLPVGSSPRMRGKLSCVPQGTHHCRIIPAHAGQTLGDVLGGMYDKDHPRACGANSGPGIPCQHIFGSSPRMRGKRQQFRA